MNTMDKVVARKSYDLVSDVYMIELELVEYLTTCTESYDLNFKFMYSDFVMFLEWYDSRDHSKCVVSTERCQLILNLMFDLSINLY